MLDAMGTWSDVRTCKRVMLLNTWSFKKRLKFLVDNPVDQEVQWICLHIQIWEDVIIQRTNGLY